MSSPSTPLPDVACGRLSLAEYAHNFGDAHPPLSAVQALIEAERCYYCYDAPCITACPTGIDIPTFIRRIAQDNLRGAAHRRSSRRTSSAACARASARPRCCASRPACATRNEDKPVEIGAAAAPCDRRGISPSRARRCSRAPRRRGKRIAVVGAGPAGPGLRAPRWRMLGHEVTVFDARPKPGGLNEYGLATYKTVDGFAQQEIDWLLSIGGIEVRCGQALGERRSAGRADARSSTRCSSAWAWPASTRSASPSEAAAGVRDAVDFIAELRQARDVADAAGRPPRRRDRRRHDGGRRRGADRGCSAPRT